MSSLNYKFIIKVILYSIVLCIIIVSPIDFLSNYVIALLTLCVSFLLMIKSRKNIVVFVLFMFIFYINYSVIFGEYIIKGNVSVPFYEVKNILNYGIGIKTLFIFSLTLLVFYKPSHLSNTTLIKGNENILIFICLWVFLMFIGVFSIDRTMTQSYEVKITPAYEYSKLIFLLLAYYSGSNRILKTLVVVTSIFFIAQDFYYGGRITSIQLLMMLGLIFGSKVLTVKRIILASLSGLFLSNLVNQYRTTYSFSNINFVEMIDNFKKSYFVFDTATYAYYASATHIAASFRVNKYEELSSFFQFSKGIIFLGSNDSGELSSYVSNNFYFNLGGGIITSHFYFWFGWIGVIFISLFLIYLINLFNKKKINNEYFMILNVLLVSNVSRWYLYSPNQLFKGTLLMGGAIILFIIFANKLSKKEQKVDKKI